MAASSAGEELGFAMMAFSVLMFFVVGITVVRPYVNSDWEEEEEAACVLLQADILEEWVDCRGVSTVPCLRVTVNLTKSNKRAFLHFDEESVLLTPECFYVPKCQADGAKLQDEVLKLKDSLDTQLGSASSCFTDPARHPGDVILSRKYTLKEALFASLWPCLMLAGGALLLGLVRLTQCLDHLSSETRSGAAAGRLTSLYTQGKLYRMLRPSATQSPS